MSHQTDNMDSARILILQSDQQIAQAWIDALTEMDGEVVGIAGAAANADEVILKRSPNLVLADIRLDKEWDGIELAAKLHRDYGLPVVFVLEPVEETALVLAKAANPYGFVWKPVHAGPLRTTLELAFSKWKAEKAVPAPRVAAADAPTDWETWFDPAGLPIYVSLSCKPITGYDREMFLSQPNLMADIAFPDDRISVIDHWARHESDEHLPDVTFRLLTATGAERLIRHECQTVHGQDGQWLGRRCRNVDITARTEDPEIDRRTTDRRLTDRRFRDRRHADRRGTERRRGERRKGERRVQTSWEYAIGLLPDRRRGDRRIEERRQGERRHGERRLNERRQSPRRVRDRRQTNEGRIRRGTAQILDSEQLDYLRNMLEEVFKTSETGE